MKKPLIIFSVFNILILLFILFTRDKIAYVDLPKVYSSFDYQLELKKELESFEKKVSYVNDSLDLVVENFGKYLDTADFTENEKYGMYQKQLNYHNQIKQKLFQRKEGMIVELDDKILERLSIYLKEFGKEEGVDMLYGKNQDGSILYGDSDLELTEKCITFINKKYAGS